MNKKELALVVEGLVKQVQAAHNTTENLARALVGLQLQRQAAYLVAATNPPANPPPSPNSTATDAVSTFQAGD